MNMLTTTVLTMSSREISELTGKQHGHVKRDIAKMLCELGMASAGYIQSWTHPQNSQKYVEYVLPKDLTITLISGYNVKMRHVITKRWMELEEESKPALPQTFAEALQLAADQAKLIEEAKPKIEFHDTVTQSVHTYKYQEAGKKIQQRPNKFVAWLREEGYIDKINTPYQRYINQGLFKMHTGVNEHGHEYTQGRVTTKGLSYFTNKLEGIKL